MVGAIPMYMLYTLIIHLDTSCVKMVCEIFTILTQEIFILQATLPLIPFAPALLGV